jgi:hypothetical protein
MLPRARVAAAVIIFVAAIAVPRVAAGQDPDPDPPSNPQFTCASSVTFSPTSDMLNFTGCFGGYSGASNTSTNDTMIFDDPLIHSFQIFLQRIETFAGVSALGSYQYEFPFQFSVEDVAVEQNQQWVNNCAALYGGVLGCPLLPPPPVPPIGQPRQFRLKVTPVDPSPISSFQGGNGVSLRLTFRIHTLAGDSIFVKDLGLMSVIQRAYGAPPAPDESLDAAAHECLKLDAASMLGASDLSFAGLGTGFKLCFPQRFDGAAFTAAISASNVSKIESTPGSILNGPITFDLKNPQTVWMTPTSLSGVNVRFSEFNYTPRLHDYFELYSYVTSSLTALVAHVETGQKTFEAVTTPFPRGFGFTGSQPASIDIPARLAASGTFGHFEVNDLMPEGIAATGYTPIRVIGQGFARVFTQSGFVPTSGIQSVKLIQTDGGQTEIVNIVECPQHLPFHPICYRITSGNEMTVFAPPAQGLALVFDPTTFSYRLADNVSASLVIKGWDTEVTRPVKYLPSPTIVSVNQRRGMFYGGDHKRIKGPPQHNGHSIQ